MSYMDNPPPRWAPSHRPIRRRPLDNPPPLDDATRALILAAANRYPRFTAAELSAVLQEDGVDVDTLAVRGALETGR